MNAAIILATIGLGAGAPCGEFSADFTVTNPPERAYVDIPVSFDLSEALGIELEIRCENTEAFQSFSIYLGSGNGWYSASRRVSASRQWTRIALDRTKFRIEDTPTGFHAIDRVRISGWRALGDPGRSKVEYRGIRPFGQVRESEIVFLMPENNASAYADKLLADLEKLGMNCGMVADRDLRPGMLAKARLLILPYNQKLPGAAEAQVEEFLGRGGKLFVGYLLPGRTSQWLGVRRKSTVHAEGGAFKGMARVGKGLDLQPDFVPQGSWCATDFEVSSPETRIIASWRNGGGPETPAVAVSPKGVFMSHVWLSAVGASDLAGALVAELLPDLKPGIAAAVEKRKAKHRADLEFARSLKPVSGEHRAFWCHSALGLGGGRDWDSSIRFLKDNGFNCIHPNLLWGDRAFFNSSVLSVDPSVAKKGDQLEACLAACRRHGVECHVWKVCWRCWHGVTEDFLSAMRREGRLQANRKGEEQQALCPSDPRNQAMEVAAMLEIAKKGVDGIHFDYIRQQDHNSCYCEGCKRRQAASGLDWVGFRAECISKVVRETAERVRREAPGVKISAAVFGDIASARDEYGQDWVRWCREGWLDFVCPMDYKQTTEEYVTYVRAQRKAIGDFPMYPGIGLSCFADPEMDLGETARQIDALRRLGEKGYTIFDFDRRAETMLRDLKIGD